jgi:hypothetical protein
MLNYLSKVKLPFRVLPNKQFFSNDRNKKFKIIENPSEISKLIFDEKGLCKIYDFKSGEHSLRKILRYVAILTFVNGALFGMEVSRPSLSLHIQCLEKSI